MVPSSWKDRLGPGALREAVRLHIYSPARAVPTFLERMDAKVHEALPPQWVEELERRCEAAGRSLVEELRAATYFCLASGSGPVLEGVIMPEAPRVKVSGPRPMRSISLVFPAEWRKRLFQLATRHGWDVADEVREAVRLHVASPMRVDPVYPPRKDMMVTLGLSLSREWVEVVDGMSCDTGRSRAKELHAAIWRYLEAEK